jgi:hypothetical protein
VSEVDTGGELTVDHYRPVSADGDDADDNLVYACFRCNQYKGDFFPNEEDLARQRRVLHPLRDEMDAHVRLNEYTGQLEPLTETGRFHVALLQLNRPALVQHRQHRQLLVLLATKQRLLAAEVAQLRTALAELKSNAAYLRKLLSPPPHEAGPES